MSSLVALVLDSQSQQSADYLNKLRFRNAPSSVTSERAFSAAGLFSTKIRSRLGDSTLNSLVFLRDFYKRQNKNV